MVTQILIEFEKLDFSLGQGFSGLRLFLLIMLDSEIKELYLDGVNLFVQLRYSFIVIWRQTNFFIKVYFGKLAFLLL